MAIVSVRLSVRHDLVPIQGQVRYRLQVFTYGSLESLVSYEVIWCRWVRRPLERGHQRGVPT